jgi:hypothetical protein
MTANLHVETSGAVPGARFNNLKSSEEASWRLYRPPRHEKVDHQDLHGLSALVECHRAHLDQSLLRARSRGGALREFRSPDEARRPGAPAAASGTRRIPPTMPPGGLGSLSTSSRIVIAAVCPPLAARPRNTLSRAVLSSRWNGCGSNSAAKALIRSASTRNAPEPKVWPTVNRRESGRSFGCAPVR